VPVSIEPGGDRLEGHDRVPAVWREPRFGRDAQAVEVVGMGFAWHGDPPAVGTWEV
jgi:hypothetical protein